MTENNIIDLTPFRADLARSLARRGERLMATTELADEVAALEPLEAYYIVRDIGLGQALPVLLQLNEEQLEACVDLDCWNRYDFSPDRLDEWLTAFALAGVETLAKSFFSLDNVVQLLFLAQTVTVYDPDTDQVPPEDEENEKARAMTPDGFYLLELKTELELKIHPFTLLDAMYRYDSSATHRLLSKVRVDLPTQILEEALHFRNGRMEDLGFMPPDEAVILFSKPSKKQPLPRPHKTVDGTITRLPAVYAESLLETTLLQQALSLITDQEFLARLEQEIVWVINSAIIAYGEKMQGLEYITDIAERVRDTISLGLESLLAQQQADCPSDGAVAAAKASDLLNIWPMAELFRHGFSAALSLKREVKQAMLEPSFNAWYNTADAQQSDEPGDRLGRAFVTALLSRHPLSGGFDPNKAEGIKAFASLADIAAAHARLKHLVAKISH
jgi:hypothetical protein